MSLADTVCPCQLCAKCIQNYTGKFVLLMLLSEKILATRNTSRHLFGRVQPCWLGLKWNKMFRKILIKELYNSIPEMK